MIDNVYYNYETVQSLLAAIDKLETEIDTVKHKNIEKESSEMEDDSHIHNWSQRAQDVRPSVSPGTQSHPPVIKVVENSPDTISANASSIDNRDENSSKSKNKTKKETTIEDLSTEVGSMTLLDESDTQGMNVRTTTGANFAKLFLKQMNLRKLGESASTNMDEFEQFDLSVTKTYAPLPPYRVSRYVIYKCINTIHIYYPIIMLPELKNSLDKMYTSPKDVSLHDKFLLYMVISIGLERSENDPELANYRNQFNSVEYFNTSYKYLETILHNRSESSLQAILVVIIWVLNSNVIQVDDGDLWHLGRFAMSLGMELGVHRFNPEWDFGEMKNELRNRLFWCTYVLERTISVQFNRGLSLRKQAIDTPLPKLLKDDYLAEIALLESDDLKAFDRVQYKPCLFLINICEAYGDLLETLYITGPEGDAPELTEEEMLDFKMQLQNTLNQWMIQVDSEIPNTLDCYYELKTKYCVASILLNGPSPSFPKPDVASILKCKTESEACVECYAKLIEKGWKINSQCLHDLVYVGLTFVYCCWKLDDDSTNLKTFSAKALSIAHEIIKYYPSFTKFKNLFIIVSSVIIDSFDKLNSIPSNQMKMSNTEFLRQHIPQQLQYMKQSLHGSSSSMIANGIDLNVMEFNDWFTQELFQDVFSQYYHPDNNMILQELDRLFGTNSNV
jgi:hypothetical protein